MFLPLESRHRTQACVEGPFVSPLSKAPTCSCWTREEARKQEYAWQLGAQYASFLYLFCLGKYKNSSAEMGMTNWLCIAATIVDDCLCCTEVVLTDVTASLDCLVKCYTWQQQTQRIASGWTAAYCDTHSSPYCAVPGSGTVVAEAVMH